jgi:hypothetical protein
MAHSSPRGTLNINIAMQDGGLKTGDIVPNSSYASKKFWARAVVSLSDTIDWYTYRIRICFGVVERAEVMQNSCDPSFANIIADAFHNLLRCQDCTEEFEG